MIAMAATDTTPKYMIGVAAQLVGMHPQMLRLYESARADHAPPHRWRHSACTPTPTSPA